MMVKQISNHFFLFPSLQVSTIYDMKNYTRTTSDWINLHTTSMVGAQTAIVHSPAEDDLICGKFRASLVLFQIDLLNLFKFSLPYHDEGTNYY